MVTGILLPSEWQPIRNPLVRSPNLCEILSTNLNSRRSFFSHLNQDCQIKSNNTTL